MTSTLKKRTTVELKQNQIRETEWKTFKRLEKKGKHKIKMIIQNTKLTLNILMLMKYLESSKLENIKSYIFLNCKENIKMAQMFYKTMIIFIHPLFQLFKL